MCAALAVTPQTLQALDVMAQRLRGDPGGGQAAAQRDGISTSAASGFHGRAGGGAAAANGAAAPPAAADASQHGSSGIGDRCPWDDDLLEDGGLGSAGETAAAAEGDFSLNGSHVEADGVPNDSADSTGGPSRTRMIFSDMVLSSGRCGPSRFETLPVHAFGVQFVSAPQPVRQAHLCVWRD